MAKRARPPHSSDSTSEGTPLAGDSNSPGVGAVSLPGLEETIQAVHTILDLSRRRLDVLNGWTEVQRQEAVVRGEVKELASQIDALRSTVTKLGDQVMGAGRKIVELEEAQNVVRKAHETGIAALRREAETATASAIERIAAAVRELLSTGEREGGDRLEALVRKLETTIVEECERLRAALKDELEDARKRLRVDRERVEQELRAELERVRDEHGRHLRELEAERRRADQAIEDRLRQNAREVGERAVAQENAMRAELEQIRADLDAWRSRSWPRRVLGLGPGKT